MYTYQIIIEYDGTNFVGWQKQKNGTSVQQTIEKIFTKILKEKTILYGSGRTDAGVHAEGQSAHFILKSKINNKKLNFHARFNAKKREYKYIINNRLAPLSLEFNKAWHVKSTLNFGLMKQAAKLLEGNKDFSTFRSSSCNAKSPIKTLEDARVKNLGSKIIITFKSRSFLQQQVRSMVGCLKFVGEGKWNLKKFEYIINSKKRDNCAPPAPAHGLYLTKVSY